MKAKPTVESTKPKAGKAKDSKNGRAEKKKHVESSQSDEDVETDDETHALVEELDSGAEDAPATTDVIEVKKGQTLGKIPKPAKPIKKRASNAAEEKEPEEPGVIYVGRIPHGFYEHEIREYFSQFGDITRLRVVRNKKTGASRHRAFVEFADTEVADIAARTMDNYLLFGHILKAKVIHPDQVHRELFKGANRRFNVVPWNAMQGRHLQRPLAESKWEGKITKEEQRRVARAEKLKALGYEFEPPALKVVAAKEQTQIEYTREEMEKAVEVPKVKQIEEKGGEVKEAEETATISTLKTKKVKASKVKKVKA